MRFQKPSIFILVLEVATMKDAPPRLCNYGILTHVHHVHPDALEQIRSDCCFIGQLHRIFT